MVKRYEFWSGNEKEPDMLKAEYVLYSDYQDLQKALEEALSTIYDQYGQPSTWVSQERAAQLRSLYLGGGK